MRMRPALETVAALGAGYVATKALDRTSSAIYARQDAASREREEELRDELPTVAFVRKVASLGGVELDPIQERRFARLVHFGMGAGGGLTALVLQKTTALGPFAAGMAAALAVFVFVDEGANYVLGLTAPATAWPAEAHARGFAAHLVYGAVMGVCLSLAHRVLQRG